MDRELLRQGEELRRKLAEAEEEGRLGSEELELRLAASESLELQRNKQIKQLQVSRPSNV